MNKYVGYVAGGAILLLGIGMLRGGRVSTVLPKLPSLPGAPQASPPDVSPVVVDPYSVARPLQDTIAQQRMADQAGAQWLKQNFPSATGGVACKLPLDPYASRGVTLCNVFIGDKVTELRCEFDLTAIPLTPGACFKTNF